MPVNTSNLDPMVIVAYETHRWGDVLRDFTWEFFKLHYGLDSIAIRDTYHSLAYQGIIGGITGSGNDDGWPYNTVRITHQSWWEECVEWAYRQLSPNAEYVGSGTPVIGEDELW